MKIKKLGALLVSAALCVGMAAPAFAFEGEAAPVEQPVLPEVVEEDVVTVTDETSGALTPEGNLTLVDDYHTNYSDGSGQQFITLVSKSGSTFYLVIDRNAKGQQTVHFMNLVDEADLLALMEEEDADAYYLGYLCVDEIGNIIRPNYVSEQFPKLLEKNGLRPIRFHDLRHSCASLLLANGVPMKQIQEWLGHSDFSTTANIYAHLDYASKLSSAQAMLEGLGYGNASA